MAIKITTTQIATDFVKVLVFGDSGVGKTRLIATAPNPIIISAERGLLSLREFNLDAIEVSTLEDFYEAYEYVISEEAEKYDTICLDSVSEIAEVMISSFKKEHKDGRQAYGRLNDEMLELIRAFRDIPEKHIYFSAKQGRIEDTATGIAKYKPMMPGKTLVQQLPYLFDEVLCLKIWEDEDGKKSRYLQTQPSITTDAKDRSGTLEDPEWEPDLTEIFARIKSGEKLENKEENKDG